ncbi:hypothetical protein BV22DRAFT_1183502 [Leucogyrophana mollusca]|uniref:Uncharacterized protein n=1 Tax=Leucogyrophana mollusca TaxID=85980 RepID=A0ACB8B4D7_9AGAM|nr:hypothetical protein BV22DRAFT_1183502 [Leucogyrophana mollusca]
MMAPGPIRSRNAAPSDSGSSSANGHKAPCEYCQKLFHPQGLKTHEKSCLKKVERQKRDKEYEVLVLKQIKKVNNPAQKKKHEVRMHNTALGADRVRLPALDASLDSGERPPPDAPSQPLPDQPDPGDVPSYKDERTLMNVDQMPMDFEFAEIVQKARLNKENTNMLLKLISGITNGRTQLTLKTYAEIRQTWDHTFRKDVLRVPYKKEIREFDSSLPNGGSPLCFILYADKTHLTSSGAVKAYPVIARCANLPVDIRNGDGIGGGHLVCKGLLPF